MYLGDAPPLANLPTCQSATMTLFDRYVVALFLKIILVCYLSLAGLYLIIDIFNNLDEFTELGRQQGSLLRVLILYYGPRLIALFCEVSGLLYLLAAICTLTRLYGTHELAAVQAAGVSIRRVSQPLIVLTAVLCVASLVSREWILPRFRETLSANAQELLNQDPKPVITQIDYDSLVMFRGGSLDPFEHSIQQADFLLPHDWGTSAPQVVASRALWQPADEKHGSGFLLEKAGTPLVKQASLVHNGKTRIYSPADTQWLAPEQLFIPTGVPFEQFAHGVDWFRNASLPELIAANQSGSIRLPSVHRIEMHWRLVRPLLDFAVLLLGLPLVVRPQGQKLVVAAAYCGFLMLGVQLLVMACHFLGAQQILTPTAFAAWLPILMVFPVSLLAYQRFDH